MSSDKEIEDLRKSRIWLGGLDNDAVNEKKRSEHTPGTCEWILNNKQFELWSQGEATVLWISGIPG